MAGDQPRCGLRFGQDGQLDEGDLFQCPVDHREGSGMDHVLGIVQHHEAKRRSAPCLFLAECRV